MEMSAGTSATSHSDSRRT